MIIRLKQLRQYREAIIDSGHDLIAPTSEHFAACVMANVAANSVVLTLYISRHADSQDMSAIPGFRWSNGSR